MLNVFITVDTEVWPETPQWRESGLSEDLARDIYGITPEGEFGARYQAEVLAKYGLKGVFFVESLFSYAVDPRHLLEIVAFIQKKGHEVGLHLHPEWLKRIPAALTSKTGKLMRDFSEEDQAALVARGVERLESSGVSKVHSFRAGGFGANLDTLRALHRAGVKFDSSHNTCYLGSTCQLDTGGPLLQPTELCGVVEVPINFICDWPGHRRHAQFMACSSAELKRALHQACQRDWYSFVIVSHSFELIHRWNSSGESRPRANRIMIRRFEDICRFLDANRKTFNTTTFRDISSDTIPTIQATEPLSGALHETMFRLVEQVVKRIY